MYSRAFTIECLFPVIHYSRQISLAVLQNSWVFASLNHTIDNGADPAPVYVDHAAHVGGPTMLLQYWIDLSLQLYQTQL